MSPRSWMPSNSISVAEETSRDEETSTHTVAERAKLSKEITNLSSSKKATVVADDKARQKSSIEIKSSQVKKESPKTPTPTTTTITSAITSKEAKPVLRKEPSITTATPTTKTQKPVVSASLKAKMKLTSPHNDLGRNKSFVNSVKAIKTQMEPRRAASSADGYNVNRINLSKFHINYFFNFQIKK